MLIVDDKLHFEPWNLLHVPVAGASMAMVPLWVLAAWRRRDLADLASLALTIRLALVANAFRLRRAFRTERPLRRVARPDRDVASCRRPRPPHAGGEEGRAWDFRVEIVCHLPSIWAPIRPGLSVERAVRRWANIFWSHERLPVRVVAPEMHPTRRERVAVACRGNVLVHSAPPTFC